MYISRSAESYLQLALSGKKVVFILGARQVGKTTLVDKLLSTKQTVFLNFDIEVDKQRFLAAASLPPAEAIKVFGNPEYLVIDEAQRLPETARIVKGWYDAKLPVKIVLLGSSSLDLMDHSAESLTGRNEKLILPPLLFKEIVASKSWFSKAFSWTQLETHFAPQLLQLLMDCLVYGSYPEAVTAIQKARLLQNLSADYLLKDILQIGLVKTPDLLRKLLMLLAYQTGSEVSVNEVASSCGLSRQTIERYLGLLEETFVLFRLPAFGTNPRKEISKTNKIYFWDTGIRNALLNDFSENPLRADMGRLWENWVIAEIAKENLLTGNQKSLYFWRSKSGSEVDLVIRQGEKLWAHEIKWQNKRSINKAFTNQYQIPVTYIHRENVLVRLYD